MIFGFPLGMVGIPRSKGVQLYKILGILHQSFIGDYEAFSSQPDIDGRFVTEDPFALCDVYCPQS